LNKRGTTQPRTRVFDAFIALSRDSALIVRWPGTELPPAQQQILTRILDNLGTLGRSESWCEAALLTDAKAAASSDMHKQAVPLLGDTLSADQEIVRVLCPDPDSAFADSQSLPKTTGRGKNMQATGQRISIYDPGWNLCMETLHLHEERWSDPPGSRWVQYARPRDCFKTTPAAHRTRIPTTPHPQAARFVLDSTVLPLVTHTLPVAAAVISALI
jgi:CRISPR-associated protein Csb2